MAVTDPEGRRVAPRRAPRSTAPVNKAKKPKRDDAETRRENARGRTAEPESVRGGRAPAAVTGKDWMDVIMGGKGLSRSSSFWSKSNLRGGAHTGVDFSAPAGTALHMPVGGKVVKASYDGSFGNTVMVQDTNGNYVMFAHMQSIGVRVGDTIQPGQFVGRVGSTGNSTGPHLHLEVRSKASKGSFGNRESWRFVDPVKYLNSNGTATEAIGEGGSGGGGGISGGGGGGGGGSAGGGGGGGGSYGFSKKEMYEYLSANFGDIDTLMALDKELTDKGDPGKSLKWAIDALVKKRITDPAIAYTYLNQTAFFKKYGVDVAERLVLEKQRPGVAESSVAEIEAEISASMGANGIQLPEDEVKRLARDAWVYGWNAQQIDARIAASEHTALGGGKWDETVASLAEYADQYGTTLSDAQLAQLKADYLNGRGSEAVQTQMREQAAQKYSLFADRINAGESLRSITDAYFTQAADLLEVDPNMLEWDDPLFTGGRAFQTVDEKTGQLRQKTLDEFQRDIRQDSRWTNTQNARKTLTDATYNLLNRMGLVS